jgi:hypothetical protein
MRLNEFNVLNMKGISKCHDLRLDDLTWLAKHELITYYAWILCQDNQGHMITWYAIIHDLKWKGVGMDIMFKWYTW